MERVFTAIHRYYHYHIYFFILLVLYGRSSEIIAWNIMQPFKPAVFHMCSSACFEVLFRNIMLLNDLKNGDTCM